MTTTTLHWASAYIGRPWGPPGSGLSCWEFVRHVLAEHYGHHVPSDPTNALRLDGWRRLPPGSLMTDGDVLLLRGAESHVGLVIEAGHGDLRLLHANGTLRHGAPVGMVVAQPLALALADYGRAEHWSPAHA